MLTFAQKQNRPQKRVSSTRARPNMATLGPDHSEHPIFHWQRTFGNQAVQRMLQTNAEALKAALTRTASPRFGHDFSRIPIHPPAAGTIQTKLAINQPGDEYEQEADRISEQVMRMPEPRPRDVCPCGGGCPKCQAKRADQGSEPLQTKRVGSSDEGQTAAPPSVHEVLRSPGQPLDPATRAFMEPRFGYDFSQVRVHTGPIAAESARAIAAKAFTSGHEIIFAEGRYRPGGPEGRGLLAHELAHVVQQNQGAFPAKLREKGGQIARSHGSPVPAGALIQRSAKFVAGTKPEDQNLAEQVIAKDTTAADALPVLNGTAFLNTKDSFDNIAKQIGDLIDAPQLSELPGKGVVECWLESVGSNVGSYVMHLPTKPPWSKDTTVDKLRAAFEHYKVSVPSDCRTGDGDTNLTVEGDPDSAKLVDGIKAHEQHHADDYEAAFNDTIVPWDKKLTALLASGKKPAVRFRGKDMQDCAIKIVERVGHPQQVAANFLKEIVDKAKAFHDRNPQLTLHGSRAGPSCAKSWVKLKL